MDDKRFERLALLGGPVFVVLAFVGGGLAGSPPAPDDSGAKILEYFTDNDSALGVGMYLNLLAALFLIFWAGSVWRAMVRAEGGQARLAVVAVLGLGLAGAMALSNGAVVAASALQAENLTPESAQFFWALAGTFAAGIYVPAAAQVAAVSFLAMRTGFLPKWLAGLGGVTVVANLLAAVGVASDASVWFAVAFGAFILWDLWILSVTWVLRSGGDGGSAPPGSVAADPA